MGIFDFYFKWLHKKNFHGIVRENFDLVISFSIDCNGLIHDAAQKIYGYGSEFERMDEIDKIAFHQNLKGIAVGVLELSLFDLIGENLLKIITAVQPTQYLIIAVDGPAPQAKISQQRSRRFKNKSTSEFKIRFDSNCITPGTEFMVRLDKYLRKFIEININKLATVVHYSSHIVPGEGEHKIMDYFRQNLIKGEGNHVIYGMDTDFIMLTMALGVNNILLWREGIKIILDIDNLKYRISKLMADSPTAISDFILLLFLFGNDFLPTQPALTDFSTKIDQMLYIYNSLYEKYKLTYTTNDNGDISINWKNLKYFIHSMSVNESSFLTHIYKLSLLGDNPDTPKEVHSLTFIEKKSLDYSKDETNDIDMDKFRDYWYSHEFYPRGNKNLVYKYLGEDAIVEINKTEVKYKINGNVKTLSISPGDDIRDLILKIGEEINSVNVDDLQTMIINYLNTIAWTFNYYFKGAEYTNLKFYYNYYHCPLFTDINNFFSHIEDVDSVIFDYLPSDNNSFLNVFQQLLSVLPSSSVNLLPQELRWFMTDFSSPIIDYYPNAFIIDYELKDRQYKGIPILPFVDPQRIINAINNHIVFNDSMVTYYTRISPLMITRDPKIDKIIQETRELKENLSSQRRGRGRGGRGDRGRGRGRGTTRGESGGNIEFKL